MASPDAALLELFGATPSASGVAITPRTAMACPPVRAAVTAIAEAVGQLPLDTFKRGPDGAREKAPDHPAFPLLRTEANPWTSASDLRTQITIDALLHGDGVAFVNRDNDGKPVELLRLDPERVTVLVDDITGEPAYQISEPNGGKRTLNREDVLHIRAPSLNGISGLSPIQSCREAIGLSIVMEQYAARLFGSGAKPSGIISFKESLKPDQYLARREAWKAAHGGTAGGGTAILDNGAEWQQITLSAVDAQFLELRQFQLAEIARCFRIPPVFLGDYGRATWSNIIEMGQIFLTYTLQPWLLKWESEARLKLIAPEDRDNYFVEFNTNALLRSDVEKRGTFYQVLRANGILSANEIRALENYPPREGGDTYENPNTTPGAPKNA